ncbi:MAG: cysteine--tRNA ligase, partial [Burkholderiales bacterium]|nr:cysteine--tRNA ligase [Burkholderiales bacterium]
KGFAYQISNGDVYYSVKKFKNYGMLSGKSLEDIIAGERVEIDANKQNPMDFVLWKKAKEGEPYWDSPFGNGRPGWHIECSAMSEELLGKTFDIHGGGQDLQFPHHENEIAQSEAHNDCKFANYWIHNGFLNINDEKMSKSLGNFLTLRNVLENYDSEVIKYFMLKTHYRGPLNFRFSLLNEARHELTKFYMAIKEFNITFDTKSDFNWNNDYALKFKKAMDDDFNTPLAISILFEILTQININKDKELAILIVQLFNILGILTKNSVDFLQSDSKLSTILITDMIEQRNKAKTEKNYFLADSIRNELKENGIIIEDNTKGTQWRKIQ